LVKHRDNFTFTLPLERERNKRSHEKNRDEDREAEVEGKEFIMTGREERVKEGPEERKIGM
jgi:hypothetical protein